MKRIASILVTCLFFIIACQTKDQVILKRWLNKEVKFFDSMQQQLPIDWNSKYKILNYIGQEGCLTCKLHLQEWLKIIKEAEEQKYDLDFIFCICTSNHADLLYNLNINNFDYPIFIDKDDVLNKLNQFPVNSKYSTFLLDSDNRILSIGDPAINLKIWELYKKLINNNVSN